MGNLSNSQKIGSLDRRITIQTPTTTQSGSGAVEIVFSDLGTMWANVDSQTKSEKFSMERETNFNKKLFTVRFRSDFDEKSKVIFDSKEYDIISINEIDGTRKRFLQIEAERRE